MIFGRRHGRAPAPAAPDAPDALILDDEALAAVPTAAGQGLLACHHCATVWRGAADGDRCARCGTRMHRRKPQSLQRTWALLIAAALCYIPANTLPVMVTRSLFGTQRDTILSGVIYFWEEGAWELAAIIFIASFLVPLFKLTALSVLAVAAGRRTPWRRHERATLYRVVEFIGRWSMLDVFVVSLLTGLVHLKGLAEINAGLGIVAFAAVVVLTMLASMSFDPRLSWDDVPEPHNAGPAPNIERTA